MHASLLSARLVPLYERNLSPPRVLRCGLQAGIALRPALHASRGECQVAAAQIVLELAGRKRLGVEEALRLLALLREQEGSLRRHLDAFGNDLEVEIVRHGDERA